MINAGLHAALEKMNFLGPRQDYKGPGKASLTNGGRTKHGMVSGSNTPFSP